MRSAQPASTTKVCNPSSRSSRLGAWLHGPSAVVLCLVAVAAIFGCDRLYPSSNQDRSSKPDLHQPAAQAGEKAVQPGPRRSADAASTADSSPPHVQLPSPVGEPSAAPRSGTGPPSVSGLTPPHAGPDTVAVEPIPKFKTRAEYLHFRSSRVPGAIAAVTLPLDYDSQPDTRYPLVIAFGGAGECARSPREGALAWMGYYKADEAVAALQDNRLERTDFKGLVTEERLRQFNVSLRKKPYQGIILVCPYSPLITVGGQIDSPDYESFVMEELLPDLKRRYRVAEESIGVDGVSMGGARSMYYGLKYPETFATIGAVQGAFGPFIETYEALVAKNGVALGSGPWVQLITSDKDSMAPSVEKMHRLLKRAGIPHRYSILTGPHDYIFNQGPGALGLLVFHNGSLPPPRPR